jgi:hypothetical protein
VPAITCPTHIYQLHTKHNTQPPTTDLTHPARMPQKTRIAHITHMSINRVHGPPIGGPLYIESVAIALTHACYPQRHSPAHGPVDTSDILDNNNLPPLAVNTGTSLRWPNCLTCTYMITPRLYNHHNQTKQRLYPNSFGPGGCPHPTAQTCRSRDGLPPQKPQILCAMYPLKVDIALVMVCRSPHVDQQHKQVSSNTKTQPFLTATNNVIPTTTQPYININHTFHRCTPHQYTHTQNYLALTRHLPASPSDRGLGVNPRLPQGTTTSPPPPLRGGRWKLP